MSIKSVKRAITENPDARAIFVNNPTYYGICSVLQSIVALDHLAGMLVLADEAHGTHLYFGEHLPQNAMAAGCDMAAVSMHKSGGSLTQSSILLINDMVNADHMRQVINLTSTTSSSYLLLSSLDLFRKHMALNGKDVLKRVVDLVKYARDEANDIGDYWALGEELIDGDAVYDFDLTKLTINTLDIALRVLKFMTFYVTNTISKWNLGTSQISLLTFLLVTGKLIWNVWFRLWLTFAGIIKKIRRACGRRNISTQSLSSVLKTLFTLKKRLLYLNSRKDGSVQNL